MENLDQKFFAYHEKNPHILPLFLKFAKQAKSVGFSHYSIRAIVNRVRWHINIETKDVDGFKMNNNYSSRYARLLVKENPEFEGFFRNRQLKRPSVLSEGKE